MMTKHRISDLKVQILDGVTFGIITESIEQARKLVNWYLNEVNPYDDEFNIYMANIGGMISSDGVIITLSKDGWYIGRYEEEGNVYVVLHYDDITFDDLKFIDNTVYIMKTPDRKTYRVYFEDGALKSFETGVYIIHQFNMIDILNSKFTKVCEEWIDSDFTVLSRPNAGRIKFEYDSLNIEGDAKWVLQNILTRSNNVSECLSKGSWKELVLVQMEGE